MELLLKIREEGIADDAQEQQRQARGADLSTVGWLAMDVSNREKVDAQTHADSKDIL